MQMNECHYPSESPLEPQVNTVVGWGDSPREGMCSLLSQLAPQSRILLSLVT